MKQVCLIKSISLQVTFVASPEDNGSQLRCEAMNEAVTKPVYNTITIELLPESTTTTSTTTTTMATKTTTTTTNPSEDPEESSSSEEDSYEYNYDEYDKEYYYEYPNQIVPTEDDLQNPAFMHPELSNVAIFTGKVDLKAEIAKSQDQEDPLRFEEKFDANFVHKTDKNSLEVDEAKWKKNKVHENEVYPKDAPYKASHSGSSMIVICSTLVFLPLILNRL